MSPHRPGREGGVVSRQTMLGATGCAATSRQAPLRLTDEGRKLLRATFHAILQGPADCGRGGRRWPWGARQLVWGRASIGRAA
jgi:hypothetical protein